MLEEIEAEVKFINAATEAERTYLLKATEGMGEEEWREYFREYYARQDAFYEKAREAIRRQEKIDRIISGIVFLALLLGVIFSLSGVLGH